MLLGLLLAGIEGAAGIRALTIEISLSTRLVTSRKFDEMFNTAIAAVVADTMNDTIANGT